MNTGNDSGRPTGKAPKALASLYGKSEEARRATARAHIGPGGRPQEVYTPREIIDAILRVWPHIELDPCTGPYSIVPARTTCFVSPKTVPAMKGGAQQVDTKGNPKFKIVYDADSNEIDGLLVPWCDYTFVNPPYARLEEWLAKAADEGRRGREVMVLCPLRPHRKWFRASTQGALVWDLNPVKFVGYKSAAPMAMCIVYWGENEMLFREAFVNLGGSR